jgi:tetratricopeptide (TPR) repeat protein
MMNDQVRTNTKANLFMKRFFKTILVFSMIGSSTGFAQSPTVAPLMSPLEATDQGAQDSELLVDRTIAQESALLDIPVELPSQSTEDVALLAQNSLPRRAAPRRAGSAPTRLPPRASSGTAPRRSGGDNNMARAKQLANSGQFQEASKLLFAMSRNPKYEAESAQIKYVLGLMLFEMKLNQAAAFVLYDVVKQESKNAHSRYLRQSLGKIAVAADALESDVLLRYAIKQVSEEEFPAPSRDMLYYRTGEVKLEEKNAAEAARQFGRVRPGSLFYTRARYKMALAYAQAGDTAHSEAAFDEIINSYQNAKVTNVNRVTALLGKARVLYQKQDFSGAIDAYRDIPRDTEQWHEALFESSWAMLRDGRFRSALSNFHSLHSAYYEDFYQPESLILRAMVYLFVCRYGEMEKVLSLFEHVYKPVQNEIHNFVTTVNEPVTYYREIAKVADNLDALKAHTGRTNSAIPFLVARHILKEGDIRHSLNYIQKLEEERKRIDALPPSWTSSGVGTYSKRVVESRLEAARKLAGNQVRHHLIVIHNDLRSFFEQSGFIRYEMLSGKKEALRKEIAGKGTPKTQVDQDNNRSFYIQNGYEYWPFTGEYWLDEIGNYHYVGVKACE